MENNNFLSAFKRIIRECNYDNTYKMAWAKALVELAIENRNQEDFIDIPLKEIAKKYIKYYWNQTIFFDNVQGSSLNKIPVILQIVKELIEKYYNYIENRKPERFERVEYLLEEQLKQDYFDNINKVAKALKADVCWRFIIINGESHEEIYKYIKNENKIIISKDNMNTLKENNEDLFDLINYRWGLILETFNSSPRINKKVKIIDEQEVKRNSLSKYKKYLDVENPNHKCFICGEVIEEKEITIDHVIPWSYLYSDDLWNLVYVHKGCNSRKNNVIPTKLDIEKLKTRNNKLLLLLQDKIITGKEVDELKLAIEKDYVNKFWIGCKN
ncbi:MAG: HNH endonuclease [Clostridia bacterium]|nr:HNH endonuclease [Clostridia bacterium]